MATIKNLDALELSEEEQKRLEQMLLDALAEDSADLEFKSYLMSFVDDPDGEISLDAQEIWQAETVRERFAEYSEDLVPEQQDLLTAFGDLDGDLGEPPSPDELEAPTSLSEWDDEPLPESTLEVPAAFSGVGDQSDQAYESEAPTAEEAPEPDVGQTEPEPVASADEEQAQAAATLNQPSDEDEDERLLRLIDALSPAMAAHAQGGGPGEASEGSPGSFLNSIKNGAGATLGGIAALAGAARASRDALSGNESGGQTKMSADEMSQLRGEELGSNVIDIRQRLGKAVKEFDGEKVRERVAMMGDAQLIGRTGAMLSTMEGIDENAPNGRYSDIDLGDGMTLGGVLKLTESADPTVAAMAKSFAGRTDSLNATNEMDFLASEYQEVADALESTAELARKQGWSEDEIADQFAKPVDDWLEKRMGEDQNLSKLAELQDSELSPEELAEREDAMKKMAENLKKLIDKLLGRDQDQEQSQGASMSR